MLELLITLALLWAGIVYWVFKDGWKISKQDTTPPQQQQRRITDELIADAKSKTIKQIHIRPEIKNKQLKLKAECAQLFSSLKDNMEQPEHLIDKLEHLFCKKLSDDFAGNKQAQCIATSMCCNVLVENDGLTMLDSLRKSKPDIENQCTHIIETVVPFIWSM